MFLSHHIFYLLEFFDSFLSQREYFFEFVSESI